jgi:hypothetical protein
MIAVMTEQTMIPVRRLGHRGAVVGIVIVLAMAVIGGLVRYFGTYPPERAASGDWGSLAFPLILAVPAVLAFLGLQHRPWLLVTTGLLLLPMCFLSFSFLFFPLLIPAILFMHDAITRPRSAPRPRVQCAAALLSAGLVIAAILSLWAHQDPVTWHTATQSGSVSDVITMQETLTSIGFLIAAVAVAALAPHDGQSTRHVA